MIERNQPYFIRYENPHHQIKWVPESFPDSNRAEATAFSMVHRGDALKADVLQLQPVVVARINQRQKAAASFDDGYQPSGVFLERLQEIAQ